MEEPMYERVKIFREKELKLSQRKFAEPMGLKQGNITQIENGRNQVSLDFIIRMEKIYGVNRDWIIDGIGPRRRSELFNTIGNGSEASTGTELRTMLSVVKSQFEMIQVNMQKIDLLAGKSKTSESAGAHYIRI